MLAPPVTKHWMFLVFATAVGIVPAVSPQAALLIALQISSVIAPVPVPETVTTVSAVAEPNAV